MAQLLAPTFGNGGDGVLTVSGNTTDAPVDSSCSGTGGTTGLSATNASFAVGQLILIHQSRGTGAGAWELNKISSYVAGTITTLLPLANTYTDGGASQAQVLVVKQYSGITVNLGITLTAKAWNGNVGGILAYMCPGKCVIPGTINAAGNVGQTTSSIPSYPTGGAGIGFRGGTGEQSTNFTIITYCGEGTGGASSKTRSANGNGGGGSSIDAAASGYGGGDGNGTAGGTGNDDPNGHGFGGTGGGTAGAADLATMVFGGGGGGGSRSSAANCSGGGGGGGIILLFAREIEVTGSITANGGGGGTHGGAGAGGSILVKTQKATLGTNLVTASGGSAANGGNGGAGRVRIESCSYTGSANGPTPSYLTGGHDFCGGVATIIE